MICKYLFRICNARPLCTTMLMGTLCFPLATARGQVINEDLMLFPSDGGENFHFGNSIAIDDGVVVVGSDEYDSYSFGSNSGSAYLFDIVTGKQLARLIPNDGEQDDRFGSSVAIDNGIVAIGAMRDNDNGTNSGSVYLFEQTTGDFIQKILPDDGSSSDQFGSSVAIDDGILAVGARFDGSAGSRAGSVYLFDVTTGAQIHKLTASDSAVDDYFGGSIAINNGVAAVGAYNKDESGTGSGSAYLFDVSTGVQLSKLLPSDGAENDRFGFSIALNNGLVAVGAYNSDNFGPGSGAVYLFSASTGAQTGKLLPIDGAPDDFFGRSVDIHQGFVAVGAYSDEDNGPGSGSVYIFDSASGLQLAKYLPQSGQPGDAFGGSIGIEMNLGVLAIGASGDSQNGPGSGSAYLIDAVTGDQTHKFLPTDGLSSDFFGSSIAIDGDSVAIGATGDDDNGSQSGSAYVSNASSGNQLVKLRPSDGNPNDRFGNSVAMDNGLVAVGASLASVSIFTRAGSAYLFDALSGNQLMKFLPSDSGTEDEFGYSIALDGGTVAVGARFDNDNGENSGSAYLFDASTGNQIAKLLPTDGSPDDEFGYSIAIEGGIVAVGSPYDGDFGLNYGAVYLFNTATGIQISKLLPPRRYASDAFGTSIAISNGILAVGAPGSGLADANAAYLYDAFTGNPLAELTPIGGLASDAFGSSIAIDSDRVVVGARNNDTNGNNAGIGYLFDVSSGTQIASFLPSEGGANERFGLSVSMDDGVVAFGVRYDSVNGSNSGSAYVFTIPCFADTNGDGILDLGDINTFVDLFLSSSMGADMNGDGILDLGDISTFVMHFLAGC